MFIYFLYSSIFLLCIVSYHIYWNLAVKSIFEKIISYLILSLLFHVIFATIFRDILQGYKYVDLGAPLGLIYGPYLYLGFIAIKNNRIERRTVILNFIPFIIALMFYIVFLSIEDFRFQYGRSYILILYSLCGISWFAYPVTILFKGNFPELFNLNSKRLYYYFIVLLLVLAAFIIPTIMSSFIDKYDGGSPISGVTVYLVMLIGIAMVYKYLFDLLIFQSKPSYFSPLQSRIKVNKGQTLFISSDPEEKVLPHKDKILAYLEKKKYLNPDFNMDIMASDLRISRSSLSLFFKEYFKQNILKTINSLRIEEVCQELRKPDFDQNIDDLAHRCGFSSRASFYRNFSLEKGCTPIEYREFSLSKLN